MSAVVPLERLAIYTESGSSSVPFKNIVLESYTFTSGRMGTSVITATLKYPTCLDGEWTLKEFVTFRGVNYVQVRVPSSSKDNSDSRYVHQLKFECVRDLVLNNVYFYDAVSEQAATVDRYQSNTSKVTFNGTLDDFVDRFNDVLSYRGLTGYEVSIESGYVGTTEQKMLTFENQTLFQALQQAYKLWNVPFYFDGYDIIFGEGDAEIQTVLEYGGDKSLMSVSKNDTDSMIVTRISGYGSSENIPYYYPNATPKGNVSAGGTAHAVITNDVKFAERFGISDTFTYRGLTIGTIGVSTVYDGVEGAASRSLSGVRCKGNPPMTVILTFTTNGNNNGGFLKVTSNLVATTDNAFYGPHGSDLFYFEPMKVFVNDGTNEYSGDGMFAVGTKKVTVPQDALGIDHSEDICDNTIILDIAKMSLIGGKTYTVKIQGELKTAWWDYQKIDHSKQGEITGSVSFSASKGDTGYWMKPNGEKVSDLSEYGLSCPNPSNGATITQSASGYVTPVDHLMPSIFRSSGGEQRFYEALNNTYPKGSGYYTFANEYDADFPKEFIQPFEDIKPTITNGNTNIIQSVYYETGFNTHDLLDDGSTMKYSYFYVRIKPLGFNLFDCGIEDGDMFMNMLDGQCGSCKFRIMRSTDRHKNTVQVDDDGDLVVDAQGMVVSDVDNPQDVQNDTTSNYVWLKLELDTDTYGGGDNGIMPSYNSNTGTGLRVLASDRFVFTNISLPQSYITEAEAKLTQALLQFMEDNNAEKYSFAIKFSRIWAAQNPTVAAQLNEHASIHLKYYDTTLPAALHVNQFTYKVESGVILPEISVVLGDVIEMQTSGMERRIQSVAEDLLLGGFKSNPMYSTDVRYLRKDIDDSTSRKITFRNGINFGDFKEGIGGTGGAVEVDVDGHTKMTIDKLIVRQLAQFTTVEIDRLRSVGGQILLSCAQIKCSSVEVVEDGFKCYFQNTDDNGNKVNNEFVVGDLAICQSFAVGTSQYYWRKVIGTGDDYIILSNVSGEYVSGSTQPSAGDNIVQLGNVSDASRQSAQILSAYGDKSPSFTMYAGINSFSLVDKDMFSVEVERVTSAGTTTYLPKTTSYGDFYFGARNKSTYVKWDRTSGKLYLKGVMSQSPSGIEFPLPVYRDAYSSTGRYYYGEVVTHNGSSWMMINPDYPDGITGIEPQEDSSYWALYASKGEDGEPGTPMAVQYSEDAVNWHDDYLPDDIYMRIQTGTEWGNAVKIKGEDGEKGDDGQRTPYHKFDFGISQYATASGAPSDITSWNDTPLSPTVQKPYLWCRDSYYGVNQNNEWVLQSTKYFRLTGEKGKDGINGADGVDGTPILWKGSFASAPSNPQNGWAYYNTVQKKSFVYQSGAWYQMTVDGVDGTNGRDGNDGLSIVWKGESANPPVNPQMNWAYRDTDNGICYIYNGTSWVMMTHDGNDGADGTDGVDGQNGLSVFITYNDSPASTTPARPTGSGTTGGWHTNPTSTSIWISQKVAASASEGTWGTPIRIKGTDGVDGTNGNTPYIGANNNWWINGQDTGVKAEGKDGNTPTIGNNGHWWIGGVDTGKIAVPADGVGISSVVNYYAIGTSNTTPPSESQFNTTFTPPTQQSPYLWNYELITYTNGTTSKTTKAVIGNFSKDGTNGVGVQSVTEYYAISSSSTTAPSDSEFSTSFVAPTSAKPYVWNYELITYTNGTTQKTGKAIVGARGNDGEKGESAPVASVSVANDFSIPTVNVGGFEYGAGSVARDGSVLTYFYRGHTALAISPDDFGLESTIHCDTYHPHPSPDVPSSTYEEFLDWFDEQVGTRRIIILVMQDAFSIKRALIEKLHLFGGKNNTVYASTQYPAQYIKRYRGKYSSTETYEYGDEVLYDNYFCVALGNITGSPDVDSDWAKEYGVGSPGAWSHCFIGQDGLGYGQAFEGIYLSAGRYHITANLIKGQGLAPNASDGKVSRGPSEWDPTVTYAGREDMSGDYFDIVMQNDLYYYCKNGNTNVSPASDVNHQYWDEANSFEFVASKVLYVDQAQINELSIKRLNTNPNDQNKNIQIQEDNAKWVNDGEIITQIYLGDYESSSGQSQNMIIGSVTVSNLTETQMKNGSSYLKVPNNAVGVSIPAITVTYNSQSQSGSDYFSLYLRDVSDVNNRRYYIYNGYSHSFTIPATVINNLPAGTYNLYVQELYNAHSITLTPSSTTVSVITSSVRNLFCADAMVIRHGTEGVKVTSQGAKVIQGNAEYNIAGIGALNGLTAPKRIVFCTSYPSVEEQGVFYIKLSQ